MREKTRNKLLYLAETKSLIKSALIEKGQEVADGDDFRSYAEKILDISGGGSADERVKYVTFMWEDVELIKYPVIVGDTVKEPVSAGLIGIPTKEPTETTEYTFDGWSLTNGGTADENALTNVTEDRTVYVAFKESARMYTVRFYDGDTLLKSEQVPYGGSSSYTYVKENYIFNGWLPEPTNVTEDMNCQAQWAENIAFADATWADIDAISRRGDASKMWSVGDRKTITIGGVQRDIVIIGFDMDKDSNGNTVGVTMTLADEAYPATKYSDTLMTEWTTSAPQVGVDSVLADLPADMQAVIKPVLKTYTSINYSQASLAEKAKSLWLFDAQELGGTKPSGCLYTLPAYPYFNSYAKAVFKVNGTAVEYHTRTRIWQYNWTNYGVIVTTSGVVNTQNAGGNYSKYVRFGFCV